MTTPTEPEALAACPFCGGEAERFTIQDEGDNFGGDVVCCKECGASSHVEFGRKENLVSCWNRRTPAARMLAGEPVDFGEAIDPNATWNMRNSRKAPQQYRKTALITASQWFKIGDHPAVAMKDDVTAETLRTGQPVPWISTLEGGHIVSPGDWIATGIEGEHWPIKPDIFAASYEPIAHPPAAEPVGLRKASEIPAAIELWFFRDLGETQRRQLINLCGFPGVEANGESLQRRILRQILAIPARTDDDGDIMLLADEAVSWALDNFGGYSCSPVDAGISYMQARGKDRWSMQAQMDASLSPAPDRGEGEA